MRICLISVEIFAWGKYGGFGRATRLIGRELTRRGHEVFAVVPRRGDQERVERLDGITVLGFDPWRPLSATSLLRDANADIYHSCEPCLSTYLAMKALPDRRHIVTFRDPRNTRDWLMEFGRPSLNRLQVIHNYFFENNSFVRGCIKKMDAVFTIARYLRPKVRDIYGLPEPARFLPTPVLIPTAVHKSDRPTVCYVARMDRRKRPERFLALASNFPHVEFLMLGTSRDKGWEASLYRSARQLRNVQMFGFIDQFRSNIHSEILGRSWIMVNTATREALPNSMIEAAAHECAIMAHVDPDGFASNYGYHVADDDFEGGLAWLIEDARWKDLGKDARAYVSATFELDHAMDQHEAAYRELLTQPSNARPVPSRP